MGKNGSFNMVERKDPVFVKFTDGEVVAGVLVTVERIKVNDGQAARYTVRDVETGELYSFLGTAQIDQRINRMDIGHLVEIRCTGSDQSVVRNGNAMKTFKVFVSDTPWIAEGIYITDADIPL